MHDNNWRLELVRAVPCWSMLTCLSGFQDRCSREWVLSACTTSCSCRVISRRPTLGCLSGQEPTVKAACCMLTVLTSNVSCPSISELGTLRSWQAGTAISPPLGPRPVIELVVSRCLPLPEYSQSCCSMLEICKARARCVRVMRCGGSECCCPSCCTNELASRAPVTRPIRFYRSFWARSICSHSAMVHSIHINSGQLSLLLDRRAGLNGEGRMRDNSVVGVDVTSTEGVHIWHSRCLVNQLTRNSYLTM